MHRVQIDRSHHMRCDICGKEEIIKETDFIHISEWWTRHWSEVEMRQFGKCTFPPYPNKINLCPTCTRKFKKLVKNVEIEESEE